jgi:hypothetical protein
MPGHRKGTIVRWLNFKEKVRQQQIKNECWRTRRNLLYYKRRTWHNIFAENVIDLEKKPCVGEDERKTKSAINLREMEKHKVFVSSADSLKKFKPLVGDWGSSDGERDDFDRDYKLRQKDVDAEKIHRKEFKEKITDLVHMLINMSVKESIETYD